MKGIHRLTVLICGFTGTAFAQQRSEPVAQRFLGFQVGDLLIILAVLLSPLVALHVQWWLQLRREARERKVRTFKTLMSTRGARVSPDHVAALNSIEVEFHKKSARNNKVVAAWRKFLDHLNTPPPLEQLDPAAQTRWREKSNDLFVALLYNMALALGYDFDEVSLKKGFYAPQGHEDLEFDQFVIRKGLVQVLSGTKSLGVTLTPSKNEAPKQERLRDPT